MKKTATLAFAAPLFLLAACEEEPSTATIAAETGGEASGEVLGGTISDDMIPLDQLTSTSPSAEPTRSAQATVTPGEILEGEDVSQSAVADQSTPQSDAAPSAPAPPQGPITAGPSQPVPQAVEGGDPPT